MSKRKSATPAMKTYILTMKDDTRRKITIPADWTLTFGALFPSKDSNGGRSALRIYESKTKQRACISDVMEFRDDSLEMQIETVQNNTHMGRVDTPVGEQTVGINVQTKKWVDPDNAEQMTKAQVEPLRLGMRENAAQAERAFDLASPEKRR